MHEVATTTELINSATASRYLETNKHNRLLSRGAVAAYTADMVAGRWKFTADPIKFDVNGTLLDGQHRLTAVAELESEDGFPFLVVRGLETDTQMFMDIGKRRTVGDQLGLKGIRNSNQVAAAVRLYLLWQTGSLFMNNNTKSAITGGVVQEWVAANEAKVEFVNGQMAMTRQLGAEPRVAAAFALRAGELNSERAQDFLTGLHSLTGLEEGDALLTLHRRLMRVRRDEIRLHTRDQLALFIQAWNKFLRDEKTSALPRPPGGAWTAATFPVMLAAGL